MKPESARPLLLAFGAASLAAVVVGALVCARSGVPASLWIRNLGGWLVAMLLGVAIARFAGRRAAPYVVAAAPLVLAASFLGQAQEGVHRWVGLGPVTMNVAMLVLPGAVVALALVRETARWAWLAALAGLAVLVLQPDASQATALGVTLAVLAAASSMGRAARAGIAATALALVAAAWLRPDPLQPVPEVEGIVGLAAKLSPLLAALAVVLMAATALVPLLASRRSQGDVRLAGAALSLCLALWAAAPWLGAYPAPLVGVGLSPILGASFGVGLLAAAMRQRAPAQAGAD